MAHSTAGLGMLSHSLPVSCQRTPPVQVDLHAEQFFVARRLACDGKSVAIYEFEGPWLAAFVVNWHRDRTLWHKTKGQDKTVFEKNWSSLGELGIGGGSQTGR